MPGPRIEILGVYRLAVTEELFREQFDNLFGSPKWARKRAEAERLCREHFDSAVLIEALVSNRDDRFHLVDFTQARIGEPEGSWQVAWAEAFLSLDGESLLVERGSDPPDAEPLRLAFFIHYWDPSQPLLTSYGEIHCPAPRAMPDRLKRLVPYEPTD